jgi:molybdopterin-containing oxidoreductase family iron-sulfur binding subunit
MSLVQIDGLASKSGPKYWRSLNELANKPEFRKWVESEFPGGTDLLAGDSRRNVLKLMAASFGLAGLAGCRRPVEKIVPMSKGVEDMVPGIPVYYNTVFTQAGHAVGVTVEAHDGRPTKIEGNPNHPQSLGKASGYMQASVLNLYDPDRASKVTQNGNDSSWEAWDKFAAETFTPQIQGRGESLRILSEAVVSPSMMEVRKALLAKFPAAKWVEYEPFTEENAFEGARLAFGQPYQVHYRYDLADVVVALDADFLGAEAGSPVPVKLFSKRRRNTNPSDEPSRLYAIESQFSVTGAMADHRLRVKAADVDGIASALAHELGVVSELNVLSGSPDLTQKFVMAVVRDLQKHRGKSVVVAGPRQPARVHALALLMNQALGNVGTTVTMTQAVNVPSLAAFQELWSEIDGGRVNTLVILGGNPAFTAPRAGRLVEAVKQIRTTVYLGDKNETSAIAKWFLPSAQYLEAWGDARAIDGTVSIQQPLILPMNDGRSPLEVAAQIAGYKESKGHDIVKNYWTAQWPPAEREARWRKSLHDGIVAGTQFAAVKAASDPRRVSLPPRTAKPEGMEVVFTPSWAIYDGRYANNGWMQETPDPMTKLVWDNAALVSPATARELGVADGDIVKLTVGSFSTEIAAMVQPGQADGSITIPVGYGRVEVGKVGRGAGFNGYIVRTGEGMGFARCSVEKTGKKYQLVTTQEHHSMEGRAIVREGTISHYRQEPEFAKEMVEAPDISIYGWWDYSKGYQWGMAVDLNSCIGCNACMVACQAENNIPIVGKDQVSRGREMHWIRLDRYYTGSEEDPQAVLQPLPCQHCENAPCESVCPVAATVHSPEGLNEMAYNRCVGTRYCANNCPYKVRRFNFLNYHIGMVEVEKMVSNPDVTVRMRGIMEKCTYCVQRIQEKRILAKTEGRRPIADGEIVTACQQTCPADAIVFGNINDPESEVSKLRAQPRNYALLAEVNTRPRTTYLAKLRNPNPELAGESTATQENHG